MPHGFAFCYGKNHFVKDPKHKNGTGDLVCTITDISWVFFFFIHLIDFPLMEQ